MRKMLTGVLLVCVFSVFFAGGQAVLVPATEVSVDEYPNSGFAIYARIDGVDGECTEENHVGWIVIDSLMFGVHVPEGGATGQSRRRASVIAEDLELVKEIDKSSPKIADAVCKGKTYPIVEIEVTMPSTEGSRVFVGYELKNVVLKSYLHHADIFEDDCPWDVFTMSYEEITMTYTEYDDEGNEKGDTEWTYVNQE